MDLARAWLGECTREHVACKNDTRGVAPTRLIYVGAHGENGTVHLHVTNVGDANIQYCCLSHCWGGADDVPRQTFERMPEFLQGLSVKTLPRTFQDAILITRQLGYRFLWIDCLCIIQNSKERLGQKIRKYGSNLRELGLHYRRCHGS